MLDDNEFEGVWHRTKKYLNLDNLPKGLTPDLLREEINRRVDAASAQQKKLSHFSERGFGRRAAETESIKQELGAIPKPRIKKEKPPVKKKPLIKKKLPPIKKRKIVRVRRISKKTRLKISRGLKQFYRQQRKIVRFRRIKKRFVSPHVKRKLRKVLKRQKGRVPLRAPFSLKRVKYARKIGKRKARINRARKKRFSRVFKRKRKRS